MNNKEPLLLSMDTATVCSTVAVTRGTMNGGRVVASVSLASQVTHSRRLITTIDWLLKGSQIDWQQIDGIGVGLGPGSFTGLRIGMATAKGLATAAGKPLIGIGTLDSIGMNCQSARLICVVLDARKKQVYSGFYRSDQNGTIHRVGDVAALSPEGLAEQIKEPTLVVGDGMTVYKELWQDQLGDLIRFGPSTLLYPAASVIGHLACEKLLEGNIDDSSGLVPLYVRSSDAELSLKKKP